MAFSHRRAIFPPHVIGATKPGRTASAQLPVARPVPGAPRLVYSAYAKGKYIDVSIYKHGEVVLCPYTAKKFRVP